MKIMTELDKRTLDCLYNLKIAGLSAQVGDIMQEVQPNTSLYDQLSTLRDKIDERVDWAALDGSVCFPD